MGKLSPEEFLKKYKPSTIESVKDNRAGGAGSVALPNNFGESQYDKQATKTDLSNLEDFRGEVQPFTSQLANGLAKAIPNTGIRAVDAFATTLGTLWGLGAGAVNTFDGDDDTTFSTGMASGVNNSMSQFLDGVSKSLGEQFPIYQTDEYKDAGIGRVLQSPFWTDTMTDAASFMASSLISGGLVTKGISALGRGGVAFSKAKQMVNALEAGKNLGTATKSTEMWKNLAASTFGATAEAGVESRETYKTIFDNLRAKGVSEEEATKQASSAANISMLANTILVGGSTFIQFGKHFTNVTDDIIDAAKISSDGTYKGFKLATQDLNKYQKAYQKLGLLTDPATEAGQEGGQFFMSKFLENYYTGNDEERDNFLESTVNAFSETFSSDGIESMMAGAVLGGLGSVGKTIYDRKNNTKTEDDFVNEAITNANNVNLDDVTSNIFGEGSKILASQMSRSMEADKAILEAKRVNDEVGAGLIKTTDFGDFVTTRLRLGKFDEVTEYLNGIKEAETEEVNKLYNSNGSTKLTDETKSTIVDNAIEQANKIKKAYDENTRRYGRIVPEEDIAKMSVAESILDYAKVEELKAVKILKDYGFDINEVLSKYKTPEEMKAMSTTRGILEKTYNDIKTDIDGRKKEGNYKGERAKELESTFNELSSITKQIENSLSDADFTTPFSIDGKTQVGNYKSIILKEINKKLNDIEQAAERNAGDLTEWQKLKDARDSFVKIQDIKDGIIDIRNKFTKDPQKFSKEASDAVTKSKASKAYNDLFKITTQPQVVKDKDGKAFIDNNTSESMILKPGLYFEGQGRVEGVYDKDGKQVVKDGKKVWKNIAHAKRDFYDILETFIEVDDAGRPVPMIKYVNKGKEQVAPLELFKNGVLNPVYNKGEVGGVISEGLMTEEEAFYQKYRNNVIQYQYLFKNKENKLETKIIHGMLGYNAQGYMVVRFKDDNGFIKDTQPFKIEKRESDGTVKVTVATSNFQVAESNPIFAKNNSQYLKILNEEQSKEWLFIDNLERTEQMYKNTLAKREASDTKTMPFEDIILEEEKAIKKNLDNAKQAIQGLDSRTKEAKSLRKAIDSMEAKLSNITSYVNTLENEKIKLREGLQRINDIIASNKQSEEFYDDLKAVKENLNKNRQHLIDTLEQIEQSNDAYESIKSLYYATLKDIKEQFNHIIDFDKFYESKYMANVIASMNNPVLDVKYTNMGLVGSDFGEILNYLIDNNNKTVDFVTNQGVRDKIKLELSKIEEVGNEDLENKLAVLEETISNMGEEAIQLMAQLKAVNRKEFADADTISTYDFYKTILQRLSESKNALTKDDTIFYGKGLKVDGYNDPFIASRREIKDAPKKSVFDSISTTSRQDITPYFPNNGSNEDKHQWVFQKFLADNDLTNDYLLEYLVDDVTDTPAPYIRNKSFDNDPTQKAILVRVVDTKGNPVLFDNTGAIKPDGIYQAIGVLEGGSGMERNAGSDTATKYTKFREVDELYKLKEDLVEEQDVAKKAEIQSKITTLETEISNGLAKYQEVRDKIISVLDKGERFITKPIEQSLGIKFEGKEELEIAEAFGENYKERIKNGDLVLDIVKDYPYILPNKEVINARVGSVIVYEKVIDGSIKTPKVYFLQPKKNNDYSLNKIVENIKKLAINEELKAGKMTFTTFYNEVKKYIYWGSVNDINKEYKGKPLEEVNNETDEELKDKLYHIRFKYGTNSQIVEFGDYIGKDSKGKPLYDIKEVSVKDIEGNEEFSNFIKSKNTHFSTGLLDNNLIKGITLDNAPLVAKLKGFTINTQRSDKLQYKSQYVRGSNEQIESLKEKKKPVVLQPPTQKQPTTSTDNIYSDLNIKDINKTIELSNTLSYKEGIEQIKLWFQSGVLKQNEGVSKQNFEDVDALLEKAKQLDENGNYNGVYIILTGYKKEAVVKDGVDEGAKETTKYDFESINALNRLLQALVSNKFVTINEALVTKPKDFKEFVSFINENTNELNILDVKIKQLEKVKNENINNKKFITNSFDVWDAYVYGIYPSKNKTFATKEEAQEWVALQYDLEIQSLKESYNSKIKPQQTATEKAVAIINNSQEAEPDVDPETYMRKNHNLNAEPKLRIKDIRSLKDLNRYYGLTPKFVKGLIDGVGFGKIAQVAGDLKMSISQDAPLFAEYHEKFHLVELFLFNKGEREVIYNWFRKSFKNNNLTDKEVSEMMAEEFRYYSIERTAKENKTFGEMIFDYLRKIIDGLSQLFTYNSDPNIKSLFDAIYDETVSSDLFKDTNVYDKNKVYGLGENFLQKQPFTREEIKSLQKHSLLAYYTELEKNIPNFSRFSFLVDGEYTKEVKQQYKEKMDIFQQFDNADTAILFNVLSSIEVANPYIAAKLSSYENKLDLAKNIKDYIDVINQNGIDIDEFIKETINQEFKGKDTAWDLEPTEIDFIKGGSSIVNMLLTTIPGDKNHLGLTEHIDINQSKVELHYLLKDIKNGAELLQKLKTSTTYWHNVLYSRLTDPRKDKAGNIVTVLDRNVAMMQVVTNFKKQIINFIQTNVKEDGVVTLIDKNRDSLLQRELYNFRNKFMFEHGITSNDYKNDVKVIELKNQLEKLKTLDGHHFLNTLGFDVDEDFDKNLDAKTSFKVTTIIRDLKSHTLSKTDDLKKLLQDPNKVSRIKQLAEIITDYKNEVTPVQVLSADNKPMYSIIERNFISKKLDELKRKFENDKSDEASLINKAEIVYNLGVNTENDVQKANKLTETPSFIMHINNMLHNISPFIATGDKSSYFGFRGLAEIYSQPIIEMGLLHDRYIRLYKNILEQEFNTFIKYKSADTDMVMPLIDQHFGVSSVFNPSIDRMLFVNNVLRFTDFNSFYNSDNFKEGFEKAIIEYTEKKVESLTKKLYDSGIAEGDKINFVDKENLKLKNIDTGYNLAHKLHLFILESNYMQSKYMIGDIGFYGMNLNKRVPTAMATKKDGNYNVAVAGLLKTHPVYGRKAKFDFNKTIDGELIFDALVYDDLFFKDEKLEKLFAKYGETNIADGAAMEHIEAIRFREWSEGTWTQEDEDLYQLDLDGKLDDASLVKFTMKKTQYYGDTVHKLSANSADTMTAPTLYKMAVMPITNSIASKSKTLRDIKKMMEDNQIPLLMADSANKITRKVETKGNGYKLFNEKSEVNTDKDNINKYKQTSFWKYYNTQQDTHKDEKWEQTQGTQFSKQIFANILEGDGILTPINSIYSNKTESTLNMVERIKAIFKDKTTVLFKAGEGAEAFYIDLLKTSDNRYFFFSEGQDPQEINKDRFAKEIENINGQIATTEEKDIYIEKYLKIVDLDQISNNPLITKEEKEEAYKDILKNNKVKAKDVISNIDNLNVARVALAKELLYERFDISKEKGGNKTASTKALLKEIKANLQQKDVPSTMIEEVIELLSNNKGLDTVLNSTSFEAVLTSLVNKMLIQPKKFGMPMAQAANIGFTQMEFSQEEGGNNIVKLNDGHDLPPLKAYIEGESEGLEVYLPSYLKEQIDISKVDSKLLRAIGFRIPTQSPNSIEKIIIKGFLPSNFGNMVIVPSSITTKSGSDFDIDKINIYLPNYYTDAGGWSVYVPAYTNDTDFDTWFETLDTKESKNSLKMKAIDNGIFENYLTILDSKEYRKQMLTPNSDKRIKDVSNEMRNREFKEKTSMADLMTIEHHIEAKQAAQLGKNILGQIALHSTHHILSQIANINISTNVPIFEGLKKLHTDGVVNLDLFRDTKGTLISDTISELVNASVDVLKDPYIKYSEITEHNTGTFLYLLRTGVPLEDVVYFFNNPVIRAYNKELAKRQFNSTDYNSTIHKEIIEKLRKAFGKEVESLGVLGNTLLKSRALADGIDYSNNVDYTVLNQFDQYFQTATVLNDLMRTTKFDTSGMGTSFGETKGIIDSYNNFIDKNDKATVNKINNVDNIFERDGVKTTMGIYKDVVSEAVSYFDSLYTSTMNKKIVANINELFKTVKSDKQTQAYNKYISDFATYITQNYNDFPAYLSKDITVKREGEKDQHIKSVANEIERIKKSKTNPLNKNLFLNTIVTDTKEAFHKVLLLQGASNSTNKYYSEQLSDSFTELMSYDAKLGYDIIKLAVLQDGFSKSPFSFLHLIPIEYKMDLLDTFYTISENIDLGNFDTRFKIKNHALAFSAARVYKPEKFSVTNNGYLVGKADQFGNRATYVKVNGKTYEIKDGNVKELNMMIGRSITDYVSPIIESESVTMDDLISSVTDRYKKLEPKNCK